MEDLQMWSLLIGFGLPNAIAVIQRPGWADWLRAVVTFVVCVFVGFITVYLQGELTGKRFITSSLLTLVTAQTTYKRFWTPTGIAPAIEKATSPGSIIIDAPSTEPTVVDGNLPDEEGVN